MPPAHFKRLALTSFTRSKWAVADLASSLMLVPMMRANILLENFMGKDIRMTDDGVRPEHIAAELTRIKDIHVCSNLFAYS